MHFRAPKVNEFMERVSSLILQLKELYEAKADTRRLMVLVRMLEAELEKQLQESSQKIGSRNVAVVLPKIASVIPIATGIEEDGNSKPDGKEEEKVFETLKVDEKEVEAELEEIRQRAEFNKRLTERPKTDLIMPEHSAYIPSPEKAVSPKTAEPERPFPGSLSTEIDIPMNEIPTLMHQPGVVQKRKEINDAIETAKDSLNDKLKQSQIELAELLTDVPVKDLKKAVSLNDRFVFISELFRGDEPMYERSIKTINSFNIYAEAEYWIQRELKIKLGWDDQDPVVKQFYQLVKRRFS